MIQDFVLPLGITGWQAPAAGFLTGWEILPPVRAGRHTITVHRDECFYPNTPNHSCPIRVWRFEGSSDGGVEEMQWGVNVPLAVSTGLVFDHQVEDYDYTPNMQHLPALVAIRFTFEPQVAREVVVDAVCACDHYQAAHFGTPIDGEYPCTRCDCQRYQERPVKEPRRLVLVGATEAPPAGGFPWSLVTKENTPFANR